MPWRNSRQPPSPCLPFPTLLTLALPTLDLLTSCPPQGVTAKLFASLFVWLKLLAKIYFCLFTTVQRIKFLPKPNQVYANEQARERKSQRGN